jgi:eukaryotic-like serine/threonine-protein kinase
VEEQDDKHRTVVDSPPGMEDDPARLIGADVGGYVVERELGRGGMGVVYAATHPIIGKRAAIKILKHSLSRNPGIVERFLQEARSVNQIGHPNIVDIFAFGTLDDGRSYLVMDLLQGEPLRKRLKRSSIPIADAVQYLEEIASALIAAHDKGFIHRDLKPDNVFLVEHPSRLEVKLLDFGLAKLIPTPTSGLSDRAYRTATGAQIGTPDYMSPEQLRGSDVDHRTDIYALGVMAFEVVARARPRRFLDGTFDLDGLSFKQALMQVQGVPEPLAELVESMVARNPDDRPTLTAVRAVLKRIRPSLPSTPALTGVRAVGSELSLGAFSPSALGARPSLQTPPATGQTAAPAPPSQPSPAPSQPSAAALSSPALRANQPGQPVLATKLGVAPAPMRTSRPHPVAAARKSENGKTWLIVGLLLVVIASFVLVFVLAT